MEIVIQFIKSIRHQIIFRDIFNKLVVQLSKNYFWCNTNQTWVWLTFYQQSSTWFQFYNHNKSVNYLQLWLILTALFWLNSISYQWENYCLVAARQGVWRLQALQKQTVNCQQGKIREQIIPDTKAFLKSTKLYHYDCQFLKNNTFQNALVLERNKTM